MNGAMYFLMGWQTHVKSKQHMTKDEWEQTKQEQADHVKERADYAETETEKQEYLIARWVVLQTT